MELTEVLEKRRSCRAFQYSTLDVGTMLSIEAAAATAPYASGGPRREIHAVTQDGLIALADACFGQEYVAECMAAFVFCGTDEAMLKSGHPKYIFDCAAACMCADLMAVSLGLGTCWIGHFDADRVKAVIGTEYRPTIILLVGVKA